MIDRAPSAPEAGPVTSGGPGIDVALQLRVGDDRRHFDLDIAFASEAPVVALYGPSGAGKSLTLQAMAGLLDAQRGHVHIGGRRLFDSAAGIDVPAPERRLGFLFQQYALFPHMSVRENVAFGLTSLAQTAPPCRSNPRRRTAGHLWAHADGRIPPCHTVRRAAAACGPGACAGLQS